MFKKFSQGLLDFENLQAMVQVESIFRITCHNYSFQILLKAFFEVSKGMTQNFTVLKIFFKIRMRLLKFVQRNFTWVSDMADGTVTLALPQLPPVFWRSYKQRLRRLFCHWLVSCCYLHNVYRNSLLCLSISNFTFSVVLMFKPFLLVHLIN